MLKGTTIVFDLDGTLVDTGRILPTR